MKRRFPLGWIIRLLLVLALLTGAGYGWQFVQGKRNEVIASRLTLERRPALRSHYASQEAELRRRQDEITQIQSLVISRDNVGQVVGEIERTAGSAGATLQIPKVEEKFVQDEKGQPILPAGPLFDVRIKLVANGQPKQLLNLLYAIEHMPYLLYLESWDLTSVRPEGPDTLEGSAADSEAAFGQLNASVVVAVWKDDSQP